MFHSIQNHLFDSIFVILFATSVGIFSNVGGGSSSSSDQLKTINGPSRGHRRQSYHQASFMDFILDPNLIENLKQLATHNEKIQQNSSTSYRRTKSTSSSSSIANNHGQLCSMLSNLLTGNQMKFCHRHQDLLVKILPQVIQLTHTECLKITSDLRWNCSSNNHLLDRSNPLALTREATLVRSILNAAMVYLILKTCNDRDYHGSCGCHSHEQDLSDNHLNSIIPVSITTSRRENHTPEVITVANDGQQETISLQDFSQADLSRLDSGLPLSLTDFSMFRKRQACLANFGFAYAFTKVFLDSDDNRSLNRAYRVLYGRDRNSNNDNRRTIDSDNKDLAFIKWSKSAINLHNNHVGRQMVRNIIQNKCRCHGISGVCPFQTCWDQLQEFGVITKRLRSMYLSDMTRVEVKNFGTYENPDLRLTRYDALETQSTVVETAHETLIMHQPEMRNLLFPIGQKRANISGDYSPLEEEQQEDTMVRPDELIYLYNSPEYCEPIPEIRHPGTRGRLCEPMKQMIERTKRKEGGEDETGSQQASSTGGQDELPPGSCEQLCCNRGCHKELILDLVACNCRFRFCCEVKCDHCLRQRVQHSCL